MRRLDLLFIVVASTITGMNCFPAFGAPAPSPSPSSVTECPVWVNEVIPVDPTDEHAARAYGINFIVFGVDEGRFSGNVRLYANNEHYDVAVKDVIALAPRRGIEDRLDTILVRLPRVVRVSGVSLVSMDGPQGGPCGVTSVVRPLTWPFRGKNPLAERLRAKAPLVALNGVPDEPVTCKEPDKDARLLDPGVLQKPPFAAQMNATGQTGVAVALLPDGRAASAWVWRSSGRRDLDIASVNAVASSRFAPQIFHCRSVAGVYQVMTDFH